MKYKNIVKGKFLSRPNRFIALVEIDGKKETVHVKNTGRCKELLIQGASVYLEKSDNPERKTAYDLIAVEKSRPGKQKLLINIDSQAPNTLAFEFLQRSTLFSENALIRREVTHGDSRFDFYIEDGEKRAFLEVKGVTLENDGTAMFPDAPTERGVKHINGLIKCTDEGYDAYILFIIQMKDIDVIKPNDITHKEFGEALRMAKNKGVKIFAVDCIVTPDEVLTDKQVDVQL